MAPPNPLELAAEGVRTLQAFGRRIPMGGGVLAPSLKDRVNGRVVLITGASSGIGRAAALKVGEAGGIVLLVARTKKKLDELAREIDAAGGTGYSHPCDLTDSDDIDRMAQEVLEQHQAVDILINNADKSIRRSMAPEVIADRIHVTTVYMPLVRTPMIAPTKLYDRFPTLSPDEAADMIADAIRRRPKRIATTLGTLAQVTYAVAPGAQDLVANRAYQLLPEGDGSKAKAQELTPEQRAFVRATRGVHW